MSVELWGASVKPVQAAPQRWTGVIKPTRILLERWKAIRASVTGHLKKVEKEHGPTHKYTRSAQDKVDSFNRLRASKQALMEHCALLKGTHEVIADAQYLDASAGAHTHMLMIEQRATTFNKAQPLSVMNYNEDGT